MSDKNYDDDIKVLEPREHVRKRPGMYFGGVDKGAVHVLLYDVLTNAVEAAMVQLCSNIEISLHRAEGVTVRDNSPGLPVENNQLEMIMSKLGGQNRWTLAGYKISGGMMGVGVSAVNAASESCTAEVARDGYLWRQQYRGGKPITEVEQVRALTDGEATGTTITFKPDFTIFEQHEFDFEEISAQCQLLAFLLPEVRLTVRDERGESPIEHTYFSEHGVADFVAHLSEQQSTATPMIHGTSSFNDVGYRQESAVQVAFAFQYIDSNEPLVKSFVNTIETTDGGTHLDAFYDALLSLVNRRKSTNKLTREDVERGLVAVIEIRHPDPFYESQAKIRLLNEDVYHLVAAALHEHIGRWLMTYPGKEHVKAIIGKWEENQRARTGR